MNEEIKFEKFSEREQDFFNGLVEGNEAIEQDNEYIILNYKDGSRDFILKSMIRNKSIKIKDKDEMNAQEYIEDLLEKNNNGEKAVL